MSVFCLPLSSVFVFDVRALTCAQTHPHPPNNAKNSASGLIPDHFFARNEDVFRNAVRPSHPGVQGAYAAVAAAARRLCELVAEVTLYDLYVLLE